VGLLADEFMSLAVESSTFWTLTEHQPPYNWISGPDMGSTIDGPGVGNLKSRGKITSGQESRD
jgi:hypothetical protein